MTSAYAAEGDAPAAPKAVAVHKTIDALGDGGDNPDTTLRGEDYYRLNLDINGPVTPGTDKPAKEKENIDVVFCLDFSASMDSAMSSSEETKRYQAMANIMGSDVVSSILQALPPPIIMVLLALMQYFTSASTINLPNSAS